MAYREVAFRGLGSGLNLRDADVPEHQAIDCLNVDFSERGAVSQRNGYAQFTGVELTNQPDSLFPHYESDGTKHLLVGNGNRVDAVNISGTGVAAVATTASPHFFTRFGGPTVEATYFANGVNQVQRYDGSFTVPAGLAAQTGMFLAVTPTSNRLVVARETGATAGNNSSSVNFSDAGAPETFTSTNFVDLDPGDGEAISGIVVWGNYLFVFKPSKYWVFYGETTDITGEAVFNHRKIDSGIGCVSSRTLCAGQDGVYFLGRKGVYRTRGQEPELLSSIVDPFFVGFSNVAGDGRYYKSSVLNHGSITASAMMWHDDKLYLAVPTGVSSTNNAVLVYDTRFDWWSLYDIGASALATFRIGGQPELVFGAPTGSNYVYRHSPSYINDAMSTTGTGGSAITARWRSGWFDYGQHVETIREAVLTGSGVVGVRYAYDHRDAGGSTQTVTFSGDQDLWNDGTAGDTWGDGTSSSDLWGPADTLTSKMVRGISTRGRFFSLLLSNSTINQTFAVHEVVNHLRERRVPSVVGTEGS